MTKSPSENARRLQFQLRVCARQSKTRRFHALYGRIYSRDVPWEAWRRAQQRRRGRGNCFRTGNAGREFNTLDGFVFRSLRRWQYRRGGQRPAKRAPFTGDQIHRMGLHKLMGTVKYPAQAAPRRSSFTARGRSRVRPRSQIACRESEAAGGSRCSSSMTTANEAIAASDCCPKGCGGAGRSASPRLPAGGGHRLRRRCPHLNPAARATRLAGLLPRAARPL